MRIESKFQNKELSFTSLQENRRVNQRIPTSLRAIHSSSSGFFIEDIISDISRGGFSIHTSEHLRMGQVVELILTLPNTGQETSIQGEVVYVKNLKTPAEEQNVEPQHRVHAGLYFNFVEPSHKKALQQFIDSHFQGQHEMAPLPDDPRIRLQLEGPRKHADQFKHMASRGLFIEVAYPISIFARPRIRLMHPLTHQTHEMIGEISQTQVVGSKEKHPQTYGMSVRFDEISSEDQQVVHDILTCLDHPTSSEQKNFFVATEAKSDSSSEKVSFRKTPIC